MYKLTVKGNTRYGEFSVDPSSGVCKRTLLDLYDEQDKDDCLSMVIADSQSRSNIEENWMVLHGKPWQIVLTMDRRYQIAKLETNRIFDLLDTVGKDEVITIAYPTEEPSPIIQKSKIHKALRACAAYVVEEMFGVQDVRLLQQ